MQHRLKSWVTNLNLKPWQLSVVVASFFLSLCLAIVLAWVFNRYNERR